MTKLLLLDCDGTIREPLSGETFIKHPRDQKIMEGADRAIAFYKSEGYNIVGITNQGGVAAKHKSLDDAIAEQQYTLELFPELDYILFCPDYGGEIMYQVKRGEPAILFEEKDFDFDTFRKPNTGMLEFALAEFDPIPPILMVGDRAEDELSAKALGLDFMNAEAWRDRFIVRQLQMLPLKQ